MSSKKTGVKTTAKPAAKAPAKTAAKSTAKATTKTAAAKPTPAKAEAAAPAKPVALPENEISLKEVMAPINDSEGKVKASGRWPMIIDENDRALVFLRHRDCNIINVLDAHEMEPEYLRKSLLGALRYGKPMVINIGELDDINTTVKDRLNEINKDLFQWIISKKLLEDDSSKVPYYMQLVKDGDGEEYTSASIFGFGEAFTIIFYSANAGAPNAETKGQVIVYRIQ